MRSNISVEFGGHADLQICPVSSFINSHSPMKRKTFGDKTRDQDSGSLMLTVSASKYFSLLNIFEYTCINLYDSYNSYYSTHVLAHVPTFSGETTRSPGKVQGSSSRDGLLEGPHKRQMIHVSRHFST